MKVLILIVALLYSSQSGADGVLPALTITDTEDGGKQYSVTLQILALMTVLTFIPAIVMMMTSFTRITVVLAILRQAIGLQQTPSNQILIGLSLFLTLFIMAPVLKKVNEIAVQPYLAEQIATNQAFERAIEPFKDFMLKQTRRNDLNLFLSLAGQEMPDDPKVLSMTVLIPAFITSELKTAFQIGFMIFIPFLIIDMVIASMLMAMGMMMLSPLIISLPFKIMLFVLVDGWALVVGTLAASFGV